MAGLARKLVPLLCALGLLVGWGPQALAHELEPQALQVSEIHGAPIDAETLWRKGRDAADKGSLTEAVGFYKQSLAVDPQGRDAMVDLATALTDLERWDDARQAYERAIRVYPDDATALNGLGYVHYRQERFETAIGYFKRAIARMDDPQFHINMGLALLSQERYGQAEEQFRRTLAIAPDHYWATNNLGYVLQLEGRDEEAMDAYTAALKLDPPGVTTHLNLGSMLLDEEAFDDAAQVYSDALKKSDDVAEAHLGLAVAFENLGRLQEARREANLAVRLDAKYPNAQIAYARLLAKTGDRKLAIGEMRKAIAMAPKSTSMVFGLAQLLEQEERFDEALKAYQDYLRLEPEGSHAPEARMMARLLGER
jgi:Flp pilus assembly protein TadD